MNKGDFEAAAQRSEERASANGEMAGFSLHPLRSVPRASVCPCKRETANGRGEADTRKKPNSMDGILSGQESGQ